MLRHLRHKEIDLVKYDNCISEAENPLIYACSWYLDIVASDWHCLVWNDYKAVMPIPYIRSKRNLYFKKIQQPGFCQQLGIFSKAKVTPEIFKAFFENLLALRPIQYCFNSSNNVFLSSDDIRFSSRVNYELKLMDSYPDIKSRYSNNLIRNLKKADKSNLTISSDISTESLIKMKKSLKKHQLSNKIYPILEALINKTNQLDHGYPYVVSENGVALASAFFIQFKDRLIHLISTNSDEGRNKGAMAFLFDRIIHQHSESKLIFDFEGSMIPGVARFFSSFGAEVVNFYQYEKKT